MHDPKQIELNLDTATQFCQQLPTYHITETAKQLYDYCTFINHQKIELTLRHQITLLLMQKIDYVFDGLFKQSFSSLNPDQKTQNNILILIEGLFTLLKQSYQLVIEAQTKKLFCNKALLALCISHCLRMNLKILFIHFLLYAKTPAGLWLDCHNLYHLAEQEKVQNKTVLPPLDKEINHSTVADWYKHILLFSIANPYRLCTQELLLLYHALTFWTKHIKIDFADNMQDELFVFDLERDHAPVYASLGLFSFSRNTRVLVLKKLTPYLNSLLIEKNTGSSTEKNLPPSLIKQLVATWSYFSNRGQDRIEINQPAKIFTGFQSIIQALSTEKTNTTSFVSDCTIINESPGGFCLELNIETLKIKPPQTGDLLGISTQINENQYQLTIGIIRWVKQLDDHKIQCGLQVIGHHPLALNIQLIGEHDKDLVGDPQHILFIPEMAAFGRGESIVSPSIFKPAMKLKLLSSTAPLSHLPVNTLFVLSDMVLSTGSFKQFFIQAQ